jgi:type IV pilus assembly protein PilW
MSRRSPRGFTLIEVAVGAAVALVVIGIVTSTFLSQQRSIQALDLSREASNAARDAMLSMQQTLGRAGYGIDPRYAFDFRSYSCPGTWSSANPCRDKVNGPDEIVFVTRDPNYYWAGSATSVVAGCSAGAPCSGHAWPVTAFDATHVTVTAAAGDTFLKGQVVLMTCPQGTNPTMGEVADNFIAGSAGALQLTLVTAVAGNPYKTNIPGTHDACFDNPGVSLFLVNRYRYHIATVNGEPWLMLDRGLDFNQNGTTAERLASGTPDTADEIPIARGVEGMQIAYLLKPSTTGLTAPDNGTDWVIGNTPGTVEEPDPTATAPISAWNPSIPSPGGPPDSDTAAVRFNKHPANIRGVRIRLTVRSLRQDVTQPTPWLGDPAVAAGSTSIENRNDFTAVALGRYRRFFSSVTVATPNLASKDPFIF